jgi:NADH:ubiquinone oxidoreductase subunit 3 (subunit A)
MDVILTPPIALLIYIPLVALISIAGRFLSGPDKSNPLKSSIYSSGEEAQMHTAAPGYRPFFLVALFFAILHLGMLVMGSGSLSVISPIYLLGLLLALVALILG